MDGATIPRSPSSSVGDYVKAIWECAGEGAASTKDVAERLSFSYASVTNMFARLREMGLVEYERYHGASLTEEGLSEALRLVRRHRLIETFLLDQLGYSWEEVRGGRAAGARRFGQVHRTARRGARTPRPRPPRRPHSRGRRHLRGGRVIPSAAAAAGGASSSPVWATRPPLLTYLGERGLVPGRLLTVEEVRTVDGVITVVDEDGATHSLGAPLASALFVSSAPVDG